MAAQSDDSTSNAFGEVRTETGLAYTYDQNGNRLTISYPGSLVATYTYDRIGNRLSETLEPPTVRRYWYLQNGNFNPGNTARILSTCLQYGAGQCISERGYGMDDAGNITDMSAGANVVTLVPDDASALAQISRAGGDQTLIHRYDGRGFLARAEVWKGVPPVSMQIWSTPTYSSDGTLMSLEEVTSSGFQWTRTNVLYFGGRPVALWRKSQSGAASTTYLTTDHLGTPVFALAANGTTLWHGGFEPFGRDYQQGTSQDALTKGIFLRLPGQWLSAQWENATLGMQLYYNVHRWYEPATGRYTSVDPLLKSAAFPESSVRPSGV